MNSFAVRACTIGMLLLLASPAVVARKSTFVDPLDLPAPKASRAAEGQMRALARAGQRLVAVGIRGRIVYSDDAGKSWRQADVPVSSDLNAVTFADASHGWAVGHDGVILHSRDGGRSWTVQLDGRRLEAAVTGHYAKAAQAGDADAGRTLEAVRELMQPGPSSFFMDVAFEDARRGIAVGTFGLLLSTTDGGVTWQPWVERIDNPDFLHLNTVRRIAGSYWLVGEQGTVWRQDPASGRFVASSVNYQGSLFGIVGDERFVLAYGLRGHAFRSTDGGQSWTSVATGIAGGISDAALVGGRVVLAAQSGQLALSEDAGQTFRPLLARQPTMYAAVLGLGSDQLALAGLNGVRIQPHAQ